MYNKKQILLLLGGALIVLVCLIILVVAHSKNSSSGGKIIVQTQNGNVSINNYTKTSTQEPSNTVLFENQNYTINNLHSSNSTAGSAASFNIAIERGPVAQIRQQAEQMFLKVLGISQADACKLTVYLGVTYSADPNLSGTNWGLSFCPNGIQFPAGQ